MGHPTFRFFAQVMHDPAVCLLSERAFRTWIFLRCADPYYGGCFPADEQLAWYCRIKVRRFSAAVAELIVAGFVERGQDGRIALIARRYEQYRLGALEWSELRAAVFERDNFTCTYCGDHGGKLECDHIHPLSKGGSNDMENLTTSCLPCNRSKHAKTLAEWRPVGNA